MDDIARARKACEDIWTKISEQPKDKQNYDDPGKHEISPFEWFVTLLIIHKSIARHIHRLGHVAIRHLGEWIISHKISIGVQSPGARLYPEMISVRSKDDEQYPGISELILAKVLNIPSRSTSISTGLGGSGHNPMNSPALTITRLDLYMFFNNTPSIKITNPTTTRKKA